MSRAHEFVYPQHVRTKDDITLCHSDGMTLREYFAAMAMQGMLADESEGRGAEWTPQRCAFRSVEFADALLAELEKPR